jgi:hypothetical protein
MRRSTVIAILVIIVVGGGLTFFQIVDDQSAIKGVVVSISLLLVVSSLPDQTHAWFWFRNTRSPQSFEQAVEPDPLSALVLTYKADKTAEQHLCALLDDLLSAARRRRTNAEIVIVQERLRGSRSIDKATPLVLDDQLLDHSLRLLEDSWKLG